MSVWFGVRRFSLAIAASVAFLILTPVGALAYPPWVLAVRDCADDGQLQGHYPAKALVQALHHLPSDGDEYSDCANAIRHELDGGSGKTAEPPPANAIVTESGAIAASPEDITALAETITQAQSNEAPTFSLTATSSTTFGDIGTSASPPYQPDLQLALAFTVACGIALAGAVALRRRNAQQTPGSL